MRIRRIGRWFEIAALLMALLQAASRLALAQRESAADSAPPFRTGFTGSITASGLDNPRYVMSFRSLQRLVQRTVHGRVSRAAVDSALAGTPVALSDLTRLGLLREDHGSFRLAYLYLTGDDQHAIYRVAQSYGDDLARALDAHRPEFERITDRYAVPELRSQLRFALVAGMLLNWDGLALSTQLGYRVAPTRHPNGDVYLVHSSDVIHDIADSALFWESHTFPVQRMMFSTFGDRPSLPRSAGIPDIFEGTTEEGLEMLQATPELHGAARGFLLTYLARDLADAESLLVLLAPRPMSRDSLASRSGLPTPRFAATLALLTATGYAHETRGTYALGVPLLTASDGPIADSTLALGRRILTPWLRENYSRMQQQLSGLSPMRNGLPFPLVFSEVWHYVFGETTRQLARQRFYADPWASTSAHRGFVPFVWDRSLYRF